MHKEWIFLLIENVFQRVFSTKSEHGGEENRKKIKFFLFFCTQRIRKKWGRKNTLIFESNVNVRVIIERRFLVGNW
jgi:hypothetical protein